MPYIPGVFSFSIIAGFDYFDENPHTVRFELRDKDSRPVIVTEEFNVQMNGAKPTNAVKAEMIVNLDFKNLEFKTSGEYHMEVFIDDKPKGGSSLIASQILRGE
ncbi:hypothetical protein SDC9_169898 [bioreactor metagenome]|uniref:Uncharacterized protein n=1 Tax=bioreactor metagenome TaxID=1076179 RepID=A0A645G792_9ZZZZ